jgi:hypothetical protein
LEEIMAWYRSTTEESSVRRGGGFAFGLLVALVLLVAVAVATGVVYFRRTDNTTEIIIDQQRIEAGAEKAVEQGKSVLRETGERLQDIGEKDGNAPPN